MPDISKFNIRELFNNRNGQTVIALFAAFLIVLTGCIGFFISVLWKPFALTASVTVISIGTGIYAFRTIKSALNKEENE